MQEILQTSQLVAFLVLDTALLLVFHALAQLQIFQPDVLQLQALVKQLVWHVR
jgi:hypothetical protein